VHFCASNLFFFGEVSGRVGRSLLCAFLCVAFAFLPAEIPSFAPAGTLKSLAVIGKMTDPMFAVLSGAFFFVIRFSNNAGDSILV